MSAVPPAVGTPSLDRFIQNRAVMGLGLLGRGVYAPQMILGAGLTLLGLGFLVAPLFGASPEAAAASVGPMLAGLINLGTGAVFRRRMKHQVPVTWSLSPEAKALLWRLYRRTSIGQRLVTSDGFTFGGRRRRRRALRHARWYGWESSAPIDPKVLDVLEEAAAAFNKVQGTIESVGKNNPSLTKMTPAILTASDEAMAEILHHAAMASKFPESSESVFGLIQQRIASLKELGERMEDMAGQDSGGTNKATYSSPIDGVLEDLKLEQLARYELNPKTEEEAVQEQPNQIT